MWLGLGGSFQTHGRPGNFSVSLDLERREATESFGFRIEYTKMIGEGVFTSSPDLNDNGSPTIGATYTELF